jgi:asparagine synthase (glutamine-hydrolysing)
MFPPAHEQTHILGIRQVLPGHWARFDLESWSHETQPYFDWRLEGERGSPDLETLPEILRDAVSSRLVSDRPVGLMLSGGVDSSFILSALCAGGEHERVRCFIGDVGRSEDAEYARRCVEQVGAKAEIIQLAYGAATLERFLKICQHYEKPFLVLGNSIAMSEMYEAISETNVPVVLDGSGGDEVFGGYWSRYYASAIREAARSGDWPWVRESLAANGTHRSLGVKALLGTPWERSTFNTRLRGFRKTFSRPYFSLGFRPLPFPPPHPRDRSPASFTDALLTDAQPGGILGEWIWHNDRNAMMFGIENRSPFLDHRLIPFMHTGYRQKMHREWNKYELRRAFSNFTPLPTQWRVEKQGFNWRRKHFLYENRDAVLDLIGSSECLRQVYPIHRFVDRAHRERSYISSKLAARLLCVAGVEATTGMGCA